MKQIPVRRKKTITEFRKWLVEGGLNQFITSYSQLSTLEQNMCYTGADKDSIQGGVFYMEIEVKLFATLRDYLPKGSDRFSCKLVIEGRARVKDIVAKLKIPDDIPKIILVNGVHGKNDQALKEGDVVSIFPPVAGG